MKSFFRISILVCCMSAIFIGCSDKNISESLEIIKASQISAISAQMTSIRASIAKLETVDSELNDLISSIRDGMDVEDGNGYGMEQVIQKLEKIDVTLKQRIVDLKEYCDNPENQTSGWTATTYLTLEKHNAVLTEIADLNNTLVSELLTVIGDVDSSCSKKIAAERAKLQTEIKDLETSLKDWVNEKLTGYYTIAEAEAKLKACEEGYKTGDEALETELATLRQALETAKTELTSAYQDAIAAAISENNGRIDQKIASDIKTATDTLQEQIGSLSTQLDDLESRVADLEATVAKIISMVQSVVVVPDYSDGSVAISRVEDNKVRFEVYPLSAAESIAKTGTSILSFDYVETITKSSEEFIQLPITAVDFTGKTLLLTVDGNNLPESVLDPDSSSSANARLLISDGTSTCSSEYFPIYMNESGDEPSIQLDQKTVSISKEATNVTVNVTSNRAWKLGLSESDVEWAHPSVTEGEASAEPVPVTIVCDENTGRERTASIKFITGSVSTTLKITQEGANYVSCNSLTTLAEGTIIPKGTFIKVQVISNYDLTNLTTTKAVYAQDVLADQKGKPGTGVQIIFASAPTVAAGEVTRYLKCGDIIELDVSGFKRSVYQDAIQLDANLKTPQPVLLTSAEDADELVPVEISIEDFLNGKYENQYVKIQESVQVADTDLSKNWADPDGNSNFSINMETADGKSFVVFNSKTSNLKTVPVAQGSGQICGIASINNGTYQLIFAKATDADALTGDRFAAQIPVLKVDEALAAGSGLASVSGRVIAACSEGVVINDGSANNLYVYNASYYDNNDKPFTFNVGDIVKADGSLVTYGKVIELKVDMEKAVTSDAAIAETPAQEATVITSENIATWVPSPAGSAKVSVSGKLVISGSYINLEIDGATIKGSIKTSKDLASLNGKYVSCTGYWIGTTDKYFSIVETEVKEDASDRLSVSTNELNVAASATSASFDIASTVAWKVTSKTEGVTVDPTSGNGDATITLTFAENTSDQPKVYTIEVSSALGTETITLTQKAYVPVGAMVELTNEEIVAYFAEITTTGYKDISIVSTSGTWTGLCNTQKGLKYVQIRNKQKSCLVSPVFEKAISKIELELPDNFSADVDTKFRAFYAMPASTVLPDGTSTYSSSVFEGNYGSVKIEKGGAQTVTIDVTGEPNQIMILCENGACYMSSIKVYFK